MGLVSNDAMAVLVHGELILLPLRDYIQKVQCTNFQKGLCNGCHFPSTPLQQHLRSP